ncbi:MAG: glycosyltransferase family 4 protein [Candidatus Pacebacteria bacterium]|nr:glycosyltransferase family 4 protein [Candidatus Paceibacterota bacterium]
MKRILIFSLTYYPDVVSGAEVAIKEITDRISPEEIEFDMVTLRFDSALPKFERIGNVNVYRIGFTLPSPDINALNKFPLTLNKYLFPFIGFLKARALHKQNPYTSIWAMMANYAGFGALFFKMYKPDVEYLLTLQEGDPVEYIKNRVRFVYPLFKLIFTRANFVQTISNYLAGFAREMGYGGPLEVVPNGVDILRFGVSYETEDLFSLKQTLGKQPGDVFLVTTSRLVKKNGVDDVIRALPLLPSQIKFLVFGQGSDEPQLRALADTLKVSDRVKFLGQISHDEMPKYFKISDIFIRPSRSEGLGNSFLEAMLCGIPIIGTPVGGIPDFLFDPYKNADKEPTGVFAQVNNPESIAKQVKLLMEDKSLCARLVANAKKLVLEKYDWNLIAKNIKEKVFDKLTSSR